MTNATCAFCAIAYVPKTWNQKYCAAGCREQMKYKHAKRVPCAVCGGPTGYKSGTVLSATHNTCMAEQWQHGTGKGYRDKGCRCVSCTEWNRNTHSTYVKRREAGEFPVSPCAEEACDRPAIARGMCRMHYKRWARANGIGNPPSAAWSDTRRNNRHARRARMNGQGSNSRALLSDIIDRDGTQCASCGTEVDLELSYPNPMSKSVDHTLPLSRGGAHELANVTLMHLVCNLRKGSHLVSLKQTS